MRRFIGVPPGDDQDDAMPQLVAFFNGVGGGTVALALSGVHRPTGFSHSSTASRRPCIVVASLFAAIIGSISFWGLSSRSASCRRSSPGGRSDSARAQQPINLLLAVAAAAW